MPQIPQEIIDTIINYVTDDSLNQRNETLLQCALVCRDWLPTSRSQLLNFVDLTSARAYNSIVDNVLQSSRMRPYLVSTKSAWLEDPSKHDEPSPQEGVRQPWTHRFIHDFAGHLPNLESLTIENADWTSCPPHPSAHLPMSRFTSLAELSLSDCRLPSALMLRRMISALPSLNTLQLTKVSWSHARGGMTLSERSDTDLVRGPALETFHLVCPRGDDGCLVPFLDWLSRTPTRTSLRNLSITSMRTNISPLTDDACMAFVETVAPGLVELDVSLTPLRELAFRELRSLQKLTLNFGRRSQGHWHTVFRLFRALSFHPVIQHLQFVVWLKAKESAGPVILDEPLQPAVIVDDGLELLDATFQREPFRNLKSIDIALWGNTSFAKSEAADAGACILHLVQMKLPKTTSRGILSVDWQGCAQTCSRSMRLKAMARKPGRGCLYRSPDLSMSQVVSSWIIDASHRGSRRFCGL